MAPWSAGEAADERESPEAMALFGRRSGHEEGEQPFVERRSGRDRRRINLLDGTPAAGASVEGAGAPEEPVSAAAAIEAAEAGRFRGAIAEPLEGTVLSGVVEFVARPAETAGALRELRLEWSAEGESWHAAVAPPEAFEVVASTAQDREPKQVALMQSAELAERLRLALEGSDLYRCVEVRPAELAPGIAAWSEDRLTPRWDTSSVADGECLLRIVTVDEMGLKVASDPLRLEVDNLGPEVSLAEELSSRTLEGVEEIEISALDEVSGVALVALELSPDGQHWQRISEARRPPYLLRWTTGELPDGRYLLRALGRDGVGNESACEPIAVHVRNAPAAPRLDPPPLFLRGPLELAAHAGDQRTVQMIFELAPSGGGEWRALGTTRAPFRLALDTTQLPDGLFDLRVEALAAGGQSTHSPRVERRRVDNTPPTLALVEPHAHELESGPCSLVLEASDHGSGIERIELACRRGGEWRELPLSQDGSSCWRSDLELEPGELTLRLRAHDRAGNRTQQLVTLQVSTEKEAEPVEDVVAGAQVPAPTEPTAETESRPEAGPRELAEQRFGELPHWQEPEVRAALAQAWGWRGERAEQTPPMQVESEAVPASAEEPEAPPTDDESERPPGEEPAAWPQLQEVAQPQPATGSNLVDFPRFAGDWDIFELTQLMGEHEQQDPIRRVEREQVLYFLREHTSLDGRIPPEFDGLIRETFGELLDR
jgi:hypothetical protein